MITRVRLGHTHLSRSVEPGPPKEPPQPTPPPPPAWRRWLLPIGMLILLGLLFWPSLLRSSPTTKYSFTTFQNKVTSADVKSVSIDSNGAVTGKLSNGSEFTSQLPTARTGPRSPSSSTPSTSRSPPPRRAGACWRRCCQA